MWRPTGFRLLHIHSNTGSDGLVNQNRKKGHCSSQLTMTKSFGFGALILYFKYEIVIRYLCLLLNGKVGVFLHGND